MSLRPSRTLSALGSVMGSVMGSVVVALGVATAGLVVGAPAATAGGREVVKMNPEAKLRT